jgi:hypothetical protein
MPICGKCKPAVFSQIALILPKSAAVSGVSVYILKKTCIFLYSATTLQLPLNKSLKALRKFYS